MMIEATEKFLVAKMALKILRMEMGPIRFRTICSDLYTLMEPSLVISNIALWESYFGERSVFIGQREKGSHGKLEFCRLSKLE